MKISRPSRAQQEREDAYTWFFRGEYNRVVRGVFLVVGDRETARDITQESFARLYRHWRKVSEYERPEAWVRQVAVRLAIQHLRRRRLHDQLRLTTEDTKTEDGTRVDIERAVQDLPPSQRAAVVLYYFEDNPSSEVARILGCSEATVRVHLHKARQKLAVALRDGEIHAY